MQSCFYDLKPRHTNPVLVKQYSIVIALSRVFISFEAFRLTLIKKDRQNGIIFRAIVLKWCVVMISLSKQ